MLYSEKQDQKGFCFTASWRTARCAQLLEVAPIIKEYYKGSFHLVREVSVEKLERICCIQRLNWAYVLLNEFWRPDMEEIDTILLHKTCRDYRLFPLHEIKRRYSGLWHNVLSMNNIKITIAHSCSAYWFSYCVISRNLLMWLTLMASKFWHCSTTLWCTWPWWHYNFDTAVQNYLYDITNLCRIKLRQYLFIDGA